ncbi:MAG: FKBP-type peptidyl-prolyl cis-trans isomerase [Lentimicrobiaceae bacterium]|nr:FKBP-type peptidyl-prolyl cis-trans isomerase [Lentimicrobiaceae bacterium]
MKNRFLLALFTLLLVCNSCYRQKQHDGNTNPALLKDPLINVNKKLVKNEDLKINEYIQRHKWSMTTTGTGLRFFIYKKGNGEKAEIGKIARIAYSVHLMSGELCYTSDDLGCKEFLIGRGGVESGIEEGILLLRLGERAKFIIPSHLAFGLVGDGDKIPPKATLIYDIELVELKENQ